MISSTCEALGLPSATYYRYRNTPPPGDADIALRNAIKLIALAFPDYGYRRITAQLKRDGWAVNHKRVFCLMRDGNLLCLRKKRFLRATDSIRARLVYPTWRQTWLSPTRIRYVLSV